MYLRFLSYFAPQIINLTSFIRRRLSSFALNPGASSEILKVCASGKKLLGKSGGVLPQKSL